MKKSSALMLSAALVYSTERLVSAVEYHAERTNPLANTYPQGDQPGLAHIPNRSEFRRHMVNLRSVSKRNRKKLSTDDTFRLTFPLHGRTVGSRSDRVARSLSRVGDVLL